MADQLMVTRILLCACPAHCAQVLRAAAQARLRLNDLQATTEWPTLHRAPTQAQTSQIQPHYQLLWALLPPSASAHAKEREAAWRSYLMQPSCSANALMSVQMLYGSATQQAQQLTPWIHLSHSTAQDLAAADCMECLDGASEQKLFQRLLQA